MILIASPPLNHMLTTGYVDYIGVTFSSNFDERRLVGWVGEFTNVGRGEHGYQRRAISELGADLVSEGEDRMGMHIRVPGAAWQAMRDEDMAVEILPEYMLALGGHPTRLDLALDLHEAHTTVEGLHELKDLGQIRTRARSGKRYYGQKDDGFYVGSKGSDKFMRVYDKKLERELDQPAPHWIRLELQMRKRYAVMMTSAYVAQANKRNFINTAIRDYCDFPTNDEFQEAVSAQDCDLPMMHRKPTKFMKWLETQVIPAMLNYQEQHPDGDILRMFSLMYHTAFTERRKRE